MLHIVRRSPFQHLAYQQMLKRLATNDVVLLLDDGVYASQLTRADIAAAHQHFAIAEHLQARGLQPAEWLTVISFADMVELTLSHSPTLTWQ